MVIVLAVAGILIWKFAPVDEAINSILPNYNATGGSGSSSNSGGGGGSGANNGGTTTSPEETVSPTASPTYGFMQCSNPNDPTTCCNGLETNCDLRVNEIMYATLHNAMATFDDGFIFGPNHERQLEGAVEAGYRGINLDLCNCGGQTIFWYVGALTIVIHFFLS